MEDFTLELQANDLTFDDPYSTRPIALVTAEPALAEIEEPAPVEVIAPDLAYEPPQVTAEEFLTAYEAFCRAVQRAGLGDLFWVDGDFNLQPFNVATIDGPGAMDTPTYGEVMALAGMA